MNAPDPIRELGKIARRYWKDSPRSRVALLRERLKQRAEQNPNGSGPTARHGTSGSQEDTCHDSKP